MKFDFAIGNPPYQEEAPGESTSDKPIYHYFMDAVCTVADNVELITPARFLFNAGATPKDWNKKMLNSEHFKVIHYESDAKKVFPSSTFTGGVAVSYISNDKKFSPVRVFIPYNELNSACQKVVNFKGFSAFSNIISGRTPYQFTEQMHLENPNAKDCLSDGHYYDISSNAFASLPDVFLDKKPDDAQKYYRVLGRKNNARAYCWIKKSYAKGRNTEYIGKWKVFLPKANGASGMLGVVPARLISMPAVGMPEDIATDTFVFIGPFENKNEAEACLKYIKGKFSRVLLGTLKVTQINSRETWVNVPLQDFTDKSDIDWSKSIADIDQQLYRKYALTQDEIGFIESKVKEME